MHTYLVVVQAEHDSTKQTLYLLAGAQLDTAAVERLSAELLHDPVVQNVHWQPLGALGTDPFIPASTGSVLEVAYRPGVTDNEAESVLEGARRLGIMTLEETHMLRRYLLPATPDSPSAAQAARDFANDLVQTTLLYAPDDQAQRLAFYNSLLVEIASSEPTITTVTLRGASDEELAQISKQGVLALDLHEMRVVRDYFTALGRDPNDGELETIAQTWSEHCSHKTFKAKVNYRVEAALDDVNYAQPASQYAAYHRLQEACQIDSMIRTFLMVATQDVLKQRAEQPAPEQGTALDVLSAFVDNAGILAFGPDHEISFKVETHNHPSALEPFGGANTGVGGVVRDVLGVSGKPIANTDVLCFGMPNLPDEALPPGVLPPQRIATGVVAGVRDYGNKLGIPTVNGAVLYEPGYTANPLVFCGTLGLAPRDSNPHAIQPGDAVVVLGGRTGRDGIHGATFSSEELTHTTAATVGSAVQIGDPITEKKVLDVLLQARDLGLYSGITDCGAGGLSSAVGELGAETGVAVDLTTVPLKYVGLQPWEIWLSEAQERMVLAVPQAKLEQFLALCASEDVEATAIGTFSDDRRLRVSYGEQVLVDLGMEFLHDGRPQRVLDAVWNAPSQIAKAHANDIFAPAKEATATSERSSFRQILLDLLAHPNIATKEPIVRTYDHEVGGGTVVKPLVGVQSDGPGDAAVIQPLRSSKEGVVLGCGVNARYGQYDPYWMALASVDEAMRNIVAVGGDPNRTAILDNFCWGDPREPDRMAGLVRAAAGCYDAAVAFGTPFISGKDSLNNEWRLPNGERQPIPPTLLISALALTSDVTKSVTMDLKAAGNLLYLVGETHNELAGAHVWDVVSEAAPADSAIPRVQLGLAKQIFTAMHEAIKARLLRSCHDLSEGGLAVAAAEMAFAGEVGASIDLAAVKLEGDQSGFVRLFSESTTRFLVEVAPDQAAAFEAAMNGLPCVKIGQTSQQTRLEVRDGEALLIEAELADLKAAWQQNPS